MGILQARKLEWVAMPSSRGYSQPRDWTQVFRTAGGFFIIWANREAYKHQYTNPNPREVLSPDWILTPFSTLSCSFILNMPLDYWELDGQKRGKKHHDWFTKLTLGYKSVRTHAGGNNTHRGFFQKLLLKRATSGDVYRIYFPLNSGVWGWGGMQLLRCLLIIYKTKII